MGFMEVIPCRKLPKRKNSYLIGIPRDILGSTKLKDNSPC